jgi:hypothetical protein
LFCVAKARRVVVPPQMAEREPVSKSSEHAPALALSGELLNSCARWTCASMPPAWT